MSPNQSIEPSPYGHLLNQLIMVKKLLFLKVFTFWALILTSAVGWGQCTPSVP